MSRLPLIAILLCSVSLAVDAETAASKEPGYVLDKTTHNKEELPLLKLKDTLIKNSILDINDDVKNKVTKSASIAAQQTDVDNRIASGPIVVSKKQSKKEDPTKKSKKKDSKKRLKQFLPRSHFKKKQRRMRTNNALHKLLNLIDSHHNKGKGSTFSTKYLRGKLFKPTFRTNSKRRKGFQSRRKMFGSKRKGLRKVPKKNLRTLKKPVPKNQRGNKIMKKDGKKGTQRNTKWATKRKGKWARQNRLNRFKGRLRALRRRFKGKGKRRLQNKPNRKNKIAKESNKQETRKLKNNKTSRQNTLNRFKGTVRALTKLLKGRRNNRFSKKSRDLFKKKRQNKKWQNRLNSYMGRMRPSKIPVKGKGKKKTLKEKSKEQKT